jgi:spore coat protein U-like protein
VLAVQLRSLSNNPIPKAINEIVGLSKKSTRTWNIPIKAALNVGLAPPAVGVHSLVFSSAQTGLSFLAGSEAAVPSTCGTSILSNAFQFKIEAYVAPACLVSLVNDLDFGVTSTLDNAGYIDAQSNLALRCTKNIPYRVSLSSKNMKNNQFNMMSVRMGATTLIPYNTYKDAARTVPWDTRSPLSSVGTGDKQTYTVYGRTPVPSFEVPANQYSDINTIQITY